MLFRGRYPLRVYNNRLTPDFSNRDGQIVHAASIVSNHEFMQTPCGKQAGAGGIYEAPRSYVITCVRCWAYLDMHGDTWT
jgi:hypothetical protein